MVISVFFFGWNVVYISATSWVAECWISLCMLNLWAFKIHLYLGFADFLCSYQAQIMPELSKRRAHLACLFQSCHLSNYTKPFEQKRPAKFQCELYWVVLKSYSNNVYLHQLFLTIFLTTSYKTSQDCQMQKITQHFTITSFNLSLQAHPWKA